MKQYITIGLLCLSTIRLQAQDAELKNLINKSFSYFPQFRELNQAVQTEQDRVLEIKASGLPGLAANGSYTYNHPVSEITIPVSGAEALTFGIMPNNNYQAGLNASYTLWDFGTVKANVARAKLAVQYAKDNVEQNKTQMAFQVSTLYYQMIYLQKAIAIQDSVLRFLEANKKDTEVKLKHGDALKYDVLSIQSNIAQEYNRKIDLQNTLNKQINLLQYTTGVESANGNTFDFMPFNPVKEEMTLTAAQNNNWEFKLLNDRIKQAESDYTVSSKSGKPSLSLNAGTGYSNGYTPDIDQFRYRYSAGVSLHIPIYEGGRSDKKIKVAQSMLKQTQLGYETLSNRYMKDIRQSMNDIKSNQSSLLNAQTQVDEAKEAQKLAQSRYKNGTGTNLELTNASTNVQRASLTLLQYDFQLCLAKLELARLAGIVYW